jgi:hypothetical protein
MTKNFALRESRKLLVTRERQGGITPPVFLYDVAFRSYNLISWNLSG